MALHEVTTEVLNMGYEEESTLSIASRAHADAPSVSDFARFRGKLTQQPDHGRKALYSLRMFSHITNSGTDTA